ncbi:FAD:protein FMN transferase [Anaerosphaera multitolerans]|uniref:FAD:protein FMN transferase n=1 Tax=Anaerosphaera multitolerans TaxID=2487351 RepID=UPI0013E3E743|nr:FAD:protein FMN transferase [Anaerosphaera multitolerans]
MRKLILLFILLLLPTGCEKGYEKYELKVFDAFDTVTSIIIYERDENEANKKLLKLKEKYLELHRQFDRYNNYENVNNVKTINDNAGIKSVKVSEELYHLLEKSVYYNETISDKVNILIGPVVDYWGEYRDLYNTGHSKDEVIKKLGSAIPQEEDLIKFKSLVDLDKLVLNEEDKSVFLKEKGMELDVGACAKGYAVELLCQYGRDELEIASGMVSAGGNVKTIGEPVTKDYYKIAIQNPENIEDESKDPYITVLNIKDNSVVTSGDYQRYFTYENQRYCHIIDPESFMVADKFRSVSVIEEDSLLCDYLSTALFLMDYEDGLKLCEDLKVDAIWFFQNGEIKSTQGARQMMEGVK